MAHVFVHSSALQGCQGSVRRTVFRWLQTRPSAYLACVCLFLPGVGQYEGSDRVILAFLKMNAVGTSFSLCPCSWCEYVSQRQVPSRMFLG